MKFLEELSEAEANLSYAYSNFKRNTKSEVGHNDMKRFKQFFSNYVNHIKSFSKQHGDKWLFKTVQSTDIINEEEKDVEDLLILDDEFEFSAYKIQLSESIKQNQIIKGNLAQSFLTLAQDPHIKLSENESINIARSAITQAGWASLQAEQSLQLYARIGNQNNFIQDKDARFDIPSQLQDIKRKSLDMIKAPFNRNGEQQHQVDLDASALFSVNESMISADTQQEIQQQNQQYKNIMDMYAEFTHQNNVTLANQNQDLFNQSMQHLDEDLHLLSSTDLSGKNNILRRMQQTNNTLKRRYLQNQVKSLIITSRNDDVMKRGGHMMQLYDAVSGNVSDNINFMKDEKNTIDSDNLIDYLVQDIQFGRYTNKTMQEMQIAMGRKMTEELIRSKREDDQDQTMGDFMINRFERFVTNHEQLKQQQVYKTLKDPDQNPDKAYHFCHSYMASNRLEKQVVTQLLHKAGYSNSFDPENLNYLGTDVFFQNDSMLHRKQKQKLQEFKTSMLDGSIQLKAIDLQSDPDKITNEVLQMNQTSNSKFNVDQLKMTIKKHVVDFMHDTKHGGDILFNYDLISLDSPEQIVNSKINQMKFDLDYSDKNVTDYERSLDLKEVQSAIYLERLLNTMRVSKMVSKDYKSYFNSNFMGQSNISQTEKAYRSQQIENVMSAFKIPYKLDDDDSLIEQKDKPVLERKSNKAVNQMTHEFLNEITMLKLGDESLEHQLKGLEDYGASKNERLFMDKILYSIARDENANWLMSCTYLDPKDNDEVGLNIPMGKYEQQFTQDLIRSPFWRQLPNEKQDQILQNRYNKRNFVLRRLNLNAFDDDDLASDFKHYSISKDVDDMSETFGNQVQNFIYQLAKVPSADDIDYPLIQKINHMITGFSQAYDYYIGGESKNTLKNVDKVKNIYSQIKQKFNLNDLSEGKVRQNSEVYENLLETLQSQYFQSHSAPLQQRILQQYVQGDEKIGDMMKQQLVNKGLKNVFNVSMVGAGLLALTMGSSPYIVQTGAPLVQQYKLQGIQYANKASGLLYDQLTNRQEYSEGFEIDHVTSQLDTLARVKASVSNVDPNMTLDNLKAYQLGDDSIGLYSYLSQQQIGESVADSLKYLYKEGYSFYQTYQEVVDPMGHAQDQSKKKKYYEQLSDTATLSSKNLKDDYMQRRSEGTLESFKDDRTVEQRVQDLEQAVRQMQFYDVSAVEIKEELAQTDKIKNNTINMIKDLEDVVLFQTDQSEPSLFFNALNLDTQNVYAQSHMLPSIFKSSKYQKKLPFLDHAIYASNVTTQQTMEKLKDEYKPSDENYYNAQLAKTIWANYAVGKEVRKTKQFRINLGDGEEIDKGDYIDVFDLRQFVPEDDMGMFDRIESATLKVYDNGQSQFKKAVDEYGKLKQKDQSFSLLYDQLISKDQDQSTNQLIKKSGVLNSGQLFDIKSPCLYNTVFDPNVLLSSDKSKNIFDTDIYQTVALKLASQVQIIQQTKDQTLRDNLIAMKIDKDAQINGVYVKNIMDWDSFDLDGEEVKEEDIRKFEQQSQATKNVRRQAHTEQYLKNFQEFGSDFISQNPELGSVINQLNSITSSKGMASFATFMGGIMYSLFSKVKKRMVDSEGQEIGTKDLSNNISETFNEGMRVKKSLDRQTDFIKDKERQEQQKMVVNSVSNVNELQSVNTVVDKARSNVKVAIDSVNQVVIQPNLPAKPKVKLWDNIKGAKKILSDKNIDTHAKASKHVDIDLKFLSNNVEMEEKKEELLNSEEAKKDIGDITKEVSSLVKPDDNDDAVGGDDAEDENKKKKMEMEQKQKQNDEQFDKLMNQMTTDIQTLEKGKSEPDPSQAESSKAPKPQKDARTFGSLLGGRRSQGSIQNMEDRINFMEGNLKRTLNDLNTNVGQYLKPSPYQQIGDALNKRDRNPIADQLMSSGMPSFLGNSSKGKSGKMGKKNSVMSVLNSKRAKKLKKKQKKKRK